MKTLLFIILLLFTSSICFSQEQNVKYSKKEIKERIDSLGILKEKCINFYKNTIRLKHNLSSMSRYCHEPRSVKRCKIIIETYSIRSSYLESIELEKVIDSLIIIGYKRFPVDSNIFANGDELVNLQSNLLMKPDSEVHYLHNNSKKIYFYYDRENGELFTFSLQQIRILTKIIDANLKENSRRGYSDKRAYKKKVKRVKELNPLLS